MKTRGLDTTSGPALWILILTALYVAVTGITAAGLNGWPAGQTVHGISTAVVVLLCAFGVMTGPRLIRNWSLWAAMTFLAAAGANYLRLTAKWFGAGGETAYLPVLGIALTLACFGGAGTLGWHLTRCGLLAMPGFNRQRGPHRRAASIIGSGASLILGLAVVGAMNAPLRSQASVQRLDHDRLYRFDASDTRPLTMALRQAAAHPDAPMILANVFEPAPTTGVVVERTPPFDPRRSEAVRDVQRAIRDARDFEPPPPSDPATSEIALITTDLLQTIAEASSNGRTTIVRRPAPRPSLLRDRRPEPRIRPAVERNGGPERISLRDTGQPWSESRPARIQRRPASSAPGRRPVPVPARAASKPAGPSSSWLPIVDPTDPPATTFESLLERLEAARVASGTNARSTDSRRAIVASNDTGTMSTTSRPISFEPEVRGPDGPREPAVDDPDACSCRRRRARRRGHSACRRDGWSDA